jgi:dihydrofolate reductase
MPELIYSLTVSLDGYIADPAGEIDWTAPDDELFRFHCEQTRELGVHLMGRGLYEAMLYWETAEEDPSLSELYREFARIWKPIPKVVFPKTLESVEGNATLLREGAVDEAAKLKQQPGKDIAVGGAGLASALHRAGAITDYRLFISPVVLGGGTAFFPRGGDRVELELVESHTFSSRVIYVRYRRLEDGP